MTRFSTKEDRELEARDVIEVTSRVITNKGTIPVRSNLNSDYQVDIYFFPEDELEWRKNALCRGEDQRIFFPDRGASMLPAYVICRACPVRYECLESAIGTGDRMGIRGGFTPEERTGIRRRMTIHKESSEQASVGYDRKRYDKLLKSRYRNRLAKVNSRSVG